MSEYLDVSVLLGKTLKGITIGVTKQEIIFTIEDGTQYRMYHEEDCCERVYIEDICGDPQDLIGVPLLMAEEVTNRNEDPPGVKAPEYRDDSYTWTFYKFATINGYVTIRWYGESNGYYSESVQLVQLKGLSA